MPSDRPRARPGDRTMTPPGEPGAADAVPARVPAWIVVSALLAPVAMIGGWVVAAALQPVGFDPVRDTISALATSSAAHGWVMTTGLALTGVCHVVTAAGLHPVASPGRALLALGGLATAAVAALPVDAVPRAHGAAAGVAFVALSVWPALGARRSAPGTGAPGPRALGPRAAVTASVALLTLLVWFVLELQGLLPGDGSLTGLSERVLAGAQSLCPLVVVVALRVVARRHLAR